MLISKKTKKILSLGLLSLFLIGFSLPTTINAAGGWYFATMSGSPAAPADGSFPTEPTCKTARETEITRNYTNGQIHVNVSKCVSISKNNATTQDVIDKDPITPTPWPDVSELIGGGQATVYWIMFHNTNNQYTILDFPTKQKCDDWWNTGSNSDKILDRLCVTTKPTDPTIITIPNSQTAEEQEKNYTLLQNLPGLSGTIQLAPNCVIDPDTGLSKCTPAKGFGDYLNILIKLFIGICAVLAMVMIVMGGVQYMTSELVSSKQAAKDTITKAILGLLLALAAFAILNTINPTLLDISLKNIATANVKDTGGEPGGGMGGTFTPLSKEILQQQGIICPGTGGVGGIVASARSFKEKTSYSLNTPGYNATLDTITQYCSSYVNQVYSCVGIKSPGAWTGDIFSSTYHEEVTNVDTVAGTAKLVSTGENITLSPGDLLGWKTGDIPEFPDWNEMGHVIMYIGGGNTIEVHGPRIEKDSSKINKACSERTNAYKGALKFLIRVSKLSGTGSSTSIQESALSATYAPSNISVIVDNAAWSKQHKIVVYNKDYSKLFEFQLSRNGGFISGTKKTTWQTGILSSSQITALQLQINKPIKVAIYSGGNGIGTLTLSGN